MSQHNEFVPTPPPVGRRYSELYFDGLLDVLFRLKAVLMPWHTETDLTDPVNAMLVEIAFNGHRHSGLAEIAMAEGYTTSAQRRGSFIALAASAGRRLRRDVAAAVDVVSPLRSDPGVGETVLSLLATFLTRGDADQAALTFEYTGAAVVPGLLDFEGIVEDDPGVFGAPFDLTAPSAPFVSMEVNDALYIGHRFVMFDGLRFGGSFGGQTVSWEYHDARHARLNPSLVTDNGDGTLTLRVDNSFGDGTGVAGPHHGLIIRVTHRASGAFEDLPLLAGGTDVHELTTATYLGQAVPSTTPNDYDLSGEWLPLPITSVDPIAVGGTDVTFTLPHTTNARWGPVAVGGTTAFWIRIRMVTVAGPDPSALFAIRNTNADWYTFAPCLQGQTVTDPIGTIDGTTFQRLAFQRGPFVEGSLSSLLVGTEEWTEVVSLFSSGPDDRHFRIVEHPNGRLFVEFGDGIRGRLPPFGAAVTATYRIAAADSGNVSAGAITQNGTGGEFLAAPNNPRAATGWKARQAVEGDRTSILEVRRDLPGEVRAADRIVTPDDYDVLPRAFLSAVGSQPFTRVIVIEEGAGYKTVQLVLVGPAGAIPITADLLALELAANGSRVGLERRSGFGMVNTEVVATAFTPVTVALPAIVLTVLPGHEAAAEAAARAALQLKIAPLAREDASDDGIIGAYLWNPGFTITVKRVETIIAAGVTGFYDVSLGAFAPVVLGASELPVLGAVAISVVVATS